MSKITVVASGKGGVGKSTVSVHLGDALTRLGKKVLLLETDSGLRGMDIMLGAGPGAVFDLGDVLSGRCEPIKAIIPADFSENLHLIPAPFDHDFKPDPGDLARLVRGLSHHYDHVIIDTPAGLGKNVDTCLSVATFGLIVVTPDFVCARDAARLASLFRANGKTELGLIINKTDIKNPHSGGQSDPDEIIDTVGVRLMGVVPDEVGVNICARRGMRLPSSLLAARAFDNIAKRVSGIYTELAVE